MLKVKLLIPVLIVLSFITQAKVNSQDKAQLIAKATVEGSADKNPQSKLFTLYQNEKTQYKKITLIKFDLTGEAKVILNVLDSRGVVKENLVDGEMSAGSYSIFFKANNEKEMKEMSYTIDVNGVSETKAIQLK